MEQPTGPCQHLLLVGAYPPRNEYEDAMNGYIREHKL